MPPAFYEHYNLPSTKKLNGIEALALVERLGSVEEYPTMSKGEILERCEMKYHRSLKKCILKALAIIGITREAFENMNIFPPMIVKQMDLQFVL